MVIPILMYANETWMVTGKEKQQIEIPEILGW